MRKQKRPHRRIDPDAVLDGRETLAARELLGLIHDINPSGRDLPPRERARRYAQKSRLQSLLVRRFFDELAVEPGDEPGVVGLRHRLSGADACHAVLASLDDDARSMLQRRLDLGDDEPSVPSVTPIEEPEPPEPPSDAPLGELSSSELLRRAQAAVVAFDYDAARERFTAALERGRRDAAPRLLAVLVEHLGLDDDALRLEARLDPETLRRPEVRRLLALAAARSYQRDRAVGLIKAHTGDPAAEVFVALARGALQRSELDHALRDVSEAQRRSPSHPALRELLETVTERRAEQRAPLEADAQGLFDEGRFDEAAARAEAITARWPESAVAHSIAGATALHSRPAGARTAMPKSSVTERTGNRTTETRRFLLFFVAPCLRGWLSVRAATADLLIELLARQT